MEKLGADNAANYHWGLDNDYNHVNQWVDYDDDYDNIYNLGGCNWANHSTTIGTKF